MKIVKRLSAAFLAMAVILTMAVTAMAAVADTGFADVDQGAWYADAVVYCSQNGLMSGVGQNRFEPQGTMTRGMLATVVYRMAGSPAVSGSIQFSDTHENTWYSDAIRWAAQQEIVGGLGDGTFGVNDPVTREQIAAILWRYSGSPQAESEQFSDQADISSWAAEAVGWARSQGVVSGREGNVFDPASRAARCEVAAMLMNYAAIGGSQPDTQPEPDEGSDILIAYFSCTGNTQRVAEYIAEATGGQLNQITPQQPYTSEDLNYNNSSSRVSLEHSDPTIRPAIEGTVENMEDYQVVFIGYPIWWGDAPQIILTFMEQYDLSGKTIVPFCTSSSSGMGSSGSNLHSFAQDATWLEGSRFGSSASQQTVTQWAESLELS